MHSKTNQPQSKLQHQLQEERWKCQKTKIRRAQSKKRLVFQLLQKLRSVAVKLTQFVHVLRKLKPSTIIRQRS